MALHSEFVLRSSEGTSCFKLSFKSCFMIQSRKDALFLDQFVNHPEMEQIIFENRLTEELQVVLNWSAVKINPLSATEYRATWVPPENQPDKCTVYKKSWNISRTLLGNVRELSFDCTFNFACNIGILTKHNSIPVSSDFILNAFYTALPFHRLNYRNHAMYFHEQIKYKLVWTFYFYSLNKFYIRIMVILLAGL